MPLDGVRILNFTTLMLAEAGADVVKVERTTARRWPRASCDCMAKPSE